MKANLKSFINEILVTFNEVVRNYKADALLLSGGLDTSILAYLLSKHFRPITVTVKFEKAEAPDVHYAKIIAKLFNLPNFLKTFNLDEAVGAARYVIKVVKSFDPMEIRNDITIYIGMNYLRELGAKSVITGDGGDELFAGYSFLFNLKPREIDRWIEDVTKKWFFAAKPIGESLGLKVLQPFLDKKIVNLALRIPAELKVAELNGRVYGKYMLRKAFERFLPAEVVWRRKHPIETGSGSTKLSEIFKVSAEEFRELSKMVNLSSQEQAYYFKIYLEVVGEIPKPKNGERACPKCGAGVPINGRYCRVCGAYPV